MSRAYLRVDPQLYEIKVIRQGYSLSLFAAFVGVLCLAEHQITRGRFRDARVLKALLGTEAARYVDVLVKKGDLRTEADQSLYLVGWDEWQEGDWKVGERVKRIRDRRAGVTLPTVTHVTPPTVTSDSGATVYNPSDGGRQSVIDGAGAGGKRSGAESPSGENLGAREERADIAALKARGWPKVTRAQRKVLDEVLERHDVTGPAFAAEVIRSTPPDKDPLAAVMDADRLWQDAQRRRAEAEEASWAATKADERNGTPRASTATKAGDVLETIDWLERPAEARR